MTLLIIFKAWANKVLIARTWRSSANDLRDVDKWSYSSNKKVVIKRMKYWQWMTDLLEKKNWCKIWQKQVSNSWKLFLNKKMMKHTKERLMPSSIEWRGKPTSVKMMRSKRLRWQQLNSFRNRTVRRRKLIWQKRFAIHSLAYIMTLVPRNLAGAFTHTIIPMENAITSRRPLWKTVNNFTGTELRIKPKFSLLMETCNDKKVIK
jgi:hypothetical protein